MIDFDKISTHYSKAIQRLEGPTRQAMGMPLPQVMPKIQLPAPPIVPWTFIPFNANPITIVPPGEATFR